MMEMAGEVLPVVKNTPVLAGVNATDPFRMMPYFLKRLTNRFFRVTELSYRQAI
jgi:predicted TIM-barrel enzyme